MPSRTFSMSGRIRNTGTTRITFAVDLTAGGRTSLRKQVTLDPGVLSSTQSVSVTRSVDYGETIIYAAFLHRVSPSPANDIAATSIKSYTEEHRLTGELEGWSSFADEIPENPAGALVGWGSPALKGHNGRDLRVLLGL